MTWEEMIEMRRKKEGATRCPFDLSISSNQYHAVLNQIVGALSGLERMAVELRFMSPLPIARVAELMGMSWDGANDLIDRAALKIDQKLTSTDHTFYGGSI